MKILLILRHGKSSWKHVELADHDRPLKKRGKRDALRMGDLILNEGLVPDVILCSTAKRAMDTAELVEEACGMVDRIQFHRSLYHGYSSDYCDLLKFQEDENDVVMVVGHNPGLEELLLELTGVDEWLPTAGLAQVEFDIETWRELNQYKQGHLVSLSFPRALK